MTEPPRRSIRSLRDRTMAAASTAVRRVRADAWVMLQATAGATLAWMIARYLLQHPDPYFAPISAMLALHANLGERGVNALRLVRGVILGILVGELVLAVAGSGPGPLAVAIILSLAAARAFASPPLVVSQAAVSAILVIVVGSAESGVERVLDVLVGAGVALVFTQLLFPPDPLRLLRRAEKAVLTAMAEGLATTADAIADHDDALAARAADQLRDARDELTELRRTGQVSRNVSRRAPVWRARAKVVVREDENSEHLDLLGASCVLLARLTAATQPARRGTLEQPVRELADVIDSLAVDLSDRDARQHAADRSIAIATGVPPGPEPAEVEQIVLGEAVRLVATDVVAFAGVDIGEAVSAVREGVLDQRVPAPAPATGGFLTRLRRRWPRARR